MHVTWQAKKAFTEVRVLNGRVMGRGVSDHRSMCSEPQDMPRKEGLLFYVGTQPTRQKDTGSQARCPSTRKYSWYQPRQPGYRPTVHSVGL